MASPLASYRPVRAIEGRGAWRRDDPPGQEPSPLNPQPCVVKPYIYIYIYIHVYINVYTYTHTGQAARLPAQEATRGPSWGRHMAVLGTIRSFLEPFYGQLSPKNDKVSEELTLRYPHEGPCVATRHVMKGASVWGSRLSPETGCEPPLKGVGQDHTFEGSIFGWAVNHEASKTLSLASGYKASKVE